MKTCQRCGGRGEVLTPGWFWIQLFELDGWHDYLDEPTLEAARTRALATAWGDKVRIRHGTRVVWRGHRDPMEVLYRPKLTRA